MVKRLIYGLIVMMVVLAGCSGNRGARGAKPKDASPGQTHEIAQERFTELDGQPKGKNRPPEQVNIAPVQQVHEEIIQPGAEMIISTVPAVPLPKPGEMYVVEIDTFLVFNKFVNLADAEVRTRDFIRGLAMERALPADVSISSLTSMMYVERNARFDESVAKGIFLMSSAAGDFISEKMLISEAVFESDRNSFKWRMHYRAEIMPRAKVYNPSMELSVKLSETFLHDGEEFTLRVTPNTDGYLYFFDFLFDGSVALVFPNRLMQDNHIQAGQSWERKIGAECHPEKDFVIETLYFVFSEDRIAGWEGFKSCVSSTELVQSAGEESFVLFQQWLGKSDPKRRVEKAAQIHVIR